MSTLDKLETINDSLNDIKDAVIAKGQTPSGDITTYAAAIANITTGYPYPGLTTDYETPIVTIEGGVLPDYSAADSVKGYLIQKGYNAATNINGYGGTPVNNPTVNDNDELVNYGGGWSGYNYVYGQLPTTVTNQDWTFEFTIKTPDDPDRQFMSGFRLFSFGPSDGQSGSDDQNWCYVLCQDRGITFNKYGDSIDVHADWIIDDGNTEYTFRIRHDSTEGYYYIEQWDGTYWNMVGDEESSESINASYVLAGKSDYNEWDDYGLASIYLRDCYMTVGGVRTPVFQATTVELKPGLLVSGLSESALQTSYNIFHGADGFVLDTVSTKTNYLNCGSVTIPAHTVPEYYITNLIKIGNPTIDLTTGTVTNFTQTSYMKLDEVLDYSNKSWLVEAHFKTNNDINNEIGVIGEDVQDNTLRAGWKNSHLLLLIGTSNGWIDVNNYLGSLTISANTEYTVRYGCNYSDTESGGTHTTTWEYYIEYLDNGQWVRDFTNTKTATSNDGPATNYNCGSGKPQLGQLFDTSGHAMGSGIIYLNDLSMNLGGVEKIIWESTSQGE